MVKGKKGNMLFVGLSDKNLEKLKQDMPIKFSLKECGFNEDIEVFIFNGKDEGAMYQMIKGAIDPMKTILIDDNAPNN